MKNITFIFYTWRSSFPSSMNVMDNSICIMMLTSTAHFVNGKIMHIHQFFDGFCKEHIYKNLQCYCCADEQCVISSYLCHPSMSVLMIGIPKFRSPKINKIINNKKLIQR